MRRLGVAAAAVALVTLFVERPPLAVAAPGIGIDRAVISEPAEYFNDDWNDAMDFNNPSDYDTAPKRLALLGGSARLEGGQLVLNGVGQAFLLRVDPDSYPNHVLASSAKDSRVAPLDAEKYKRLSLRMHSDRAAAGAIGFRNCLRAGCTDGYKYFDIVPGWHDYDLDMTGSGDNESVPGGTGGVGGTRWSGQIEQIFLAPAFNLPTKPNLRIEEVRAYEWSDSITVTWPAGNGNTLWYDRDGNRSNDGNVSTGAGASAGMITSRNLPTLGLHAGALPLGAPVTLYVRDRNGNVIATGPTVRVDRGLRPRPLVINASDTGGEDFASSVLGNPWDMSDPSDVAETANVAVGFSNGHLDAISTKQLNDPVVVLNLRGRAIDARRFHKLYVRMTYEGPWGLEDEPGAGMVSRIIWRPVGGAFEQVSYPAVMEVGTHEYVMDLRTTPAAASADPAGNSRLVGWGAPETAWVGHLRFDPHEDPGGRVFHIDEIRLLADEQVGPGYGIRFVDRNWQPGTRYDLYVDNDRNKLNGLGTRLVANGEVVAGENLVRWEGAGVGPGSYFVHVVMARNGFQSTVTSMGQVQVGGSSSIAPTIVK